MSGNRKTATTLMGALISLQNQLSKLSQDIQIPSGGFQ